MAYSKPIRDLKHGDRIQIAEPPCNGRVVWAGWSESIPEGKAPPLFLISVRMPEGYVEMFFEHPDTLAVLA